MPSFQSIVIAACIILLIILLAIVAINLKSAKDKTKWPPLVSDCPDYWFDSGTGGSSCVVDSKETNKGKATSPMNFTGAIYKGANGLCRKYNWAVSNQVSWDGLTYGGPNPCASAS